MKEIKSLNDLSGKMQQAVKKPIAIQCCQIKEDFLVHTMEGVMKAKANDWLIVGVEGELYACDNQIFQKTYDLVSLDVCESE